MTLHPTKGVAMKTNEQPVSAGKHATCAWCRTHFDSVVELINHVDTGHTDPVALRPAA